MEAPTSSNKIRPKSNIPAPNNSNRQMRPATSQQPGSIKHVKKECKLCGQKKEHKLIDLSRNEMMKKKLQKNWTLEFKLIERSLAAICLECICKLNVQCADSMNLMQKVQREEQYRHRQEARQRQHEEARKLHLKQADLSNRSTPATVSAEASSASSNSGVESSKPTNSITNVSVLETPDSRPASPSVSEPVEGLVVDKGGDWPWRTRLECRHCNRSFSRRDYYTNHVRRCWRTFAVEDEDVSPYMELPTSYQCEYCGFETKLLRALRKHRPLHFWQYHCHYCNRDFNTKYECELHIAICIAEQQAKEEKAANGPSVRVTRAKTRAKSSDKPVKHYSIRERRICLYFNKDGVTEEVYSNLTPQMNRESYTGNWRENRNTRAYTLGPVGMNAVSPTERELLKIRQFGHKEYDFYLLNKLRAQIDSNNFVCLVPNCNFRTTTLVAMMRHDYIIHFRDSWFHCSKCSAVFTKKVFLDYHMYYQNPGLYICNKCNEEFDYPRQLNAHFLLHKQKRKDNEVYFCFYCRLEFLTARKLRRHCRKQNHHPDEDRIVIRYDRELSFATFPPEFPPPESPDPPELTKCYQERFIQMETLDVPSKFPKKYKKNALVMGSCEFDDEYMANCAGVERCRYM